MAVYTIPTLLILALSLSNIHGFIAYDCSGAKLNVTSFSSLEIGHCEVPPPPTTKEVPRIKLLQRADIRTTNYKSCLISVSYLVTRCASLDDAQAVEGGFYSEILFLGIARCIELHKTLVYHFPSGGIIFGLKINQTTFATQTIAGSVDKEGNCQGTSFSSDKGSWKNVIVQGNYRIELSEGMANIISKDNLLILPTGTKFKLSEMYGIDSYKGEIIWSNELVLQCDVHEFDVLYDGPASIVISEPNNDNIQQTQTFLVETNNIVFALKQIKKTFACDIPVVQTEHPQLFILIDISFMNHFKIGNIMPHNTDLMAYVNTKFVYIENFLKRTMTSLYSDLLKKQCELERTQLQQKLSLASFSLDEFAYSIGEGPGYTAIKAGEAIYLLKCRPVNVYYAKQTACYNELPVSYNNKTYFMAPKTNILQSYGSQIDCNEFLPAAFRLDSEWYGIAPSMREIKKSQVLTPSTSWTWSYKSPETLMLAGIYSHDTMEALQKHILLPQEIQAAQKNIARQSMGYAYVDQGLRLQSLVDEDTIGKIIENRLQKMWGWFTTFGTVASGLLGIYFFWNIVVVTITTGLNISILYQTFGWSIKLIAGFFSGITHYIMHNVHKKRSSDYEYFLLTSNDKDIEDRPISVKNKKQQRLRKRTQSYSI